jgi:c-di-GMP-binding flagellar brake protein YcgR
VEAGRIALPGGTRRFNVRVKLPDNMPAQPVRLYAFLLSTELKVLSADLSAGFPPFTAAQSRSLQAEGPQGYAASRIEFRIVK